MSDTLPGAVMRDRSVWVSIVASIVLTIAVLIVGTNLDTSSTLPEIGPTPAGALCDREPITVTTADDLRGRVELCITVSGMWAQIDLAGLRSGTLYTGWIVYGDRPLSAPEFPCADASERATARRHQPLHLARAVADRAGHARLMGSYPGMQLAGGLDLWMLIVRHDAVPPDDARTAVWQPAWWSNLSATDHDGSVTGSLVACGRIRRQGGIESVEYDPD